MPQLDKGIAPNKKHINRKENAKKSDHNLSNMEIEHWEKKLLEHIYTYLAKDTSRIS